MLLHLLAACTSVTVGEPPAPDQPVSYAIAPEVVDFGAPAVAEAARAFVEITNTGATDLMIVEGAAPEGVQADFHGIYALGPGQATFVDLAWVPSSPSPLEGALRVGLATDSATATADVPLVGSGQGPVLTLSTTDMAFGDVGVGCTHEFGITVTNTGNTELVLDEVRLLGDPTFSMRGVEVPLTLGPYQSYGLRVQFEPEALGADEAVVRIAGPAADATIQLSGSGFADGETTLSYDVGQRQRMTALWHVNAVAIAGPAGTHAKRLADSLETYFQTLQDQGADYRVGFLWNTTGEMDGAFIDATVSPARAAGLALEMLEAGNAGDNDQSFLTLLNGADAQSSWLFEDGAWAGSRLNLIAVQRDVEQSGGSWSTYVRQAQELKDEPEDVVFHAIAGTVPMGCGEGTEGFMGFSDAVTATGGTFLPLCEPDWNESMAQLATATLAGTGSTYFPLTGTAVPESIRVSVDGAKMSTGWAYRADLNAIAFEDDFYPASGSVIEIRYLHPTGCE